VVAIVASSASTAVAQSRKSSLPPGNSLVELRVAMVHRDASFAAGSVDALHRSKFEKAGALTWGLEAAQLPLRLPCLGGLGVGIGAHLHHHESVNRKDDKTIFQLLAFHGHAIAQLDGPAHCYAAVFVPYAKVGIVAAPWSLRQVENKVVDGKTEQDSTSVGSGTALGVSQAIGLRLRFEGEESSGRSAFGIRHSFVFLEHMRTPLEQADSTRIQLTWWTGGIAAQW
jgi:hypothetical protein